MAANDHTSPIGRRPVGRFQSFGEVKRGGMGSIDAAHDPVIRRRVAVKHLLPEHREDPSLAARFTQEAQITGQLDHPNVVPVYDLGEGEDGPFIVMKLVRGKSLEQLLLEAREGPKDPDRLRGFVQILLKLCDALSFAHSRGVIHCDLKPDNVMVGSHGEVYLMDWGVALLKARHTAKAEAPSAQPPFAAPRDLQDDHSSWVTITSDGIRQTSNFRGTPAYMAPEQLLGRVTDIDERTDVFGMGAMVFQILTGEPPNDRARLLGPAVSHEPVVMPETSDLWEQLPPGLCQIALKALSPRKDDRHPSIDELKADLGQFLLGGGWFETKQFAAGETIVAEGEPGHAAYIIERGRCEVIKDLAGHRTLIRVLGPGDVFGETAVLTEAPRTATVVAKEPTTLKVITGESLNRELDRNPWLAAFVRSLAALFREADSVVSQRGRSG